MKKFLSNFLLLLMISLSFSFIISVKADVGPKPTTTVEIIGFNQPYYFDLLMRVDESQVRVLSEEDVFEQINYFYYLDNFPDELNGFYDNDGFASYTLYRDIPHHITKSEDHTYKIGYYSPPSEFKIVLVLENGEMIISNILNKTLFNASFIFDLSDFSLTESESQIIDNVPVYLVDTNATEVIPYLQIGLQIILALLLTLAVELLVLFIFRYHNKSSYILVLKVNVVTQLILHSTLIVGYLFLSLFGYIFIFLVGELIVFILEMIFYGIYLKEKNKKYAILYALVANIVSLFIGHYLFLLFI